jgi:hypothetical protein
MRLKTHRSRHSVFERRIPHLNPLFFVVLLYISIFHSPPPPSLLILLYITHRYDHGAMQLLEVLS